MKNDLPSGWEWKNPRGGPWVAGELSRKRTRKMGVWEDYLRRERHETFYGMAPDATAEEAGECVDFAGDFLSKVRHLLKK